MSDVSCQVPTDGDPLRFPQDAVDHGEAHRRWDTEPEPGQGQGNSLKASMNQFINPIIYSLLFTFIHFYSLLFTFILLDIFFLKETDVIACHILSTGGQSCLPGTPACYACTTLECVRKQHVCRSL
jgi:hypothetical protein